MGRALLVLETPDDKKLAVHWIGKAPIGTRVEFKASKRSLPQNDLMWALLTEVAQQLQHSGRKYDPTQWKSIFLHGFGREINFLPSLDNTTFLPIELSSSDLSKEEMTDFIEYILKEGSERGVVFHVTTNPGDVTSVPAEPEDQSPPDLGSRDPADPSSQEPAGSPSDCQGWLLNITRMLWAATNFNSGVDGLDVLKNQRKVAAATFEKPADCPTIITGKAEAVYGYCKQIVDGALDKDDGKAVIAGVAMCDQDDLEKRHG